MESVRKDDRLIISEPENHDIRLKEKYMIIVGVLLFNLLKVKNLALNRQM